MKSQITVNRKSPVQRHKSVLPVVSQSTMVKVFHVSKPSRFFLAYNISQDLFRTLPNPRVCTGGIPSIAGPAMGLPLAPEEWASLCPSNPEPRWELHVIYRSVLPGMQILCPPNQNLMLSGSRCRYMHGYYVTSHGSLVGYPHCMEHSKFSPNRGVASHFPMAWSKNAVQYSATVKSNIRTVGNMESGIRNVFCSRPTF